MRTEVAEIAPDIFRLSTYIAEADFMFNQFLLRDDEPALFHTGPRALFPPVRRGVLPVDRHRAPPLNTLRPLRSRRLRPDDLLPPGAPPRQDPPWAMGSILSSPPATPRPPHCRTGSSSASPPASCVGCSPPPCPPAGTPGCSPRSPLDVAVRRLFPPGSTPPLPKNHRPPAGRRGLLRATCLPPSPPPTIRRLADLAPTLSR